MRHNPFKIDQAARDRWLSLMSEAMEEAHLNADVRAMLQFFFEESATFMINHS